MFCSPVWFLPITASISVMHHRGRIIFDFGKTTEEIVIRSRSALTVIQGFTAGILHCCQPEAFCKVITRLGYIVSVPDIRSRVNSPALIRKFLCEETVAVIFVHNLIQHDSFVVYESKANDRWYQSNNISRGRPERRAVGIRKRETMHADELRYCSGGKV